jgi:hypothetical protein
LRVFGVDFTSAPRRAKPIAVAVGEIDGRRLRVHSLETLHDFPSFEAFLLRRGPWIGGFDFPFGLPRELVRDLGWPEDWKGLVAHCRALSRPDFRKALDAYRIKRPRGKKYAHRATDIPAGSSSPMKLVNPPVALMFHEGAPRLLAAGLHVPGLREGDRSRVALEAYPGLLARRIVGRASYKNDAAAKQTAERRAIRMKIVSSLNAEMPLPVKEQVIADPSGDSLDAVLCAVQAAWAARRPRYGLPGRIDPCEGWIVSAGA